MSIHSSPDLISPLGLQTNISDLTRSDLDSSLSTVPACIVGSISWTRSSLYGAGQVKAECWSSHFLMRPVGKSHWLCFQCVFGNSNPYYLVQITVIFACLSTPPTFLSLYKIHRHYPEVKHLKLGSVQSSIFSAPGPRLLSAVGENSAWLLGPKGRRELS